MLLLSACWHQAKISVESILAIKNVLTWSAVSKACRHIGLSFPSDSKRGSSRMVGVNVHDAIAHRLIHSVKDTLVK